MCASRVECYDGSGKYWKLEREDRRHLFKLMTGDKWVFSCFWLLLTTFGRVLFWIVANGMEALLCLGSCWVLSNKTVSCCPHTVEKWRRRREKRKRQQKFMFYNGFCRLLVAVDDTSQLRQWSRKWQSNSDQDKVRSPSPPHNHKPHHFQWFFFLLFFFIEDHAIYGLCLFFS